MSERVLVADDHAPTRAGVRRALGAHGFEVCAEAADAREAVEAARRERPDVALLDIRMPGNGIEAAAQIASELPGTAVVMLTVSRDDDDLFTALRVGAAGYLLKDLAAERLPDALRAVLAGEAALPGTLVARLVEEFRERGRRRLLALPGRRGVELTDREWEVLQLVRRERTTAEIAAALFVSETTVRTHVASILRKLRVPDRRAAIRLLDER
ncbi:MAG TPA: response regulator transcription factor [Gaiellaceae bacterium]|nr:response regulator transcription factor [Gaiellaceae bacterium]